MKTTIRLVTALAAVSLAFFAATGCKQKAPNSELNLFAWSEYIPEDVIKQFEKETGIKVNYETFASGEEMLSKVLIGGTSYDLIQPCDYIAEALIKENKLAELDYAQIPNFKNIAQKYLSLPYDPAQKYTVPYMVGTVGIVVNTDKVKDPVNGFTDVFQQKYAGRIVVLDDAREIFTWAFSTIGVDVNDFSKETLAKARPIVASWMKLVKVYDSDSPKTALLNGDVDLGVVWGGEAAILWNQDKKFKFVLPENAHMFIDLLSIPATSKNKEAAHKFIDFILRPEISKIISENFPYTNPNAEALKLLSDDERNNPASYPAGLTTKSIFRHLGDERDAIIDKEYTDLKNAN